MRLRLPSRISIRLLLFNVLLVFLPVAGFLYLGVYEKQLLDDQERSMVQQGRLLAAALGGGAELGPLDSRGAEALLRRLDQRTDSRARILGQDGALLADSSLPGPHRTKVDPRYSRPPEAQGSLLYEVVVGLYRLYRQMRAPVPSRGRLAPDPFPTPAVAAALTGKYGAAVKRTEDTIWRPSLTLHSAIPIRRGGQVAGVVLVSQSTLRILRALDEVRLAILKVFLVSVIVAAILSLLLAGTITHPIRRLRDEANALLDRRGRLRGRFGGPHRADEIGDLTRALELLTARLAAHQDALESFASDVSHELKNPLASIRSATELLGEIEEPADRERFLTLVQREVARMERLLTAVREIGEIDARLETESPGLVDLDALLKDVAESFRRRADKDVKITLSAPGGPLPVRASPERLFQVFENLLDNARGFSPAGGTVTLILERRNGTAVVRIDDEGPGIPETHLDRIFDRFFTYRPGEPDARNGHTGLGLAIAKAIVEGYGGSVRAGNRTEGGAWFEVALPAHSF